MRSFSVSTTGLHYQRSRLLLPILSLTVKLTRLYLASPSHSVKLHPILLRRGPKKIAKIKTARVFPFSKHETQREMKTIFAYYTCIRCFRTVDYPQNRTRVTQTGRIIKNYQQNYR